MFVEGLAQCSFSSQYLDGSSCYCRWRFGFSGIWEDEGFWFYKGLVFGFGVFGRSRGEDIFGVNCFVVVLCDFCFLFLFLGVIRIFSGCFRRFGDLIGLGKWFVQFWLFFWFRFTQLFQVSGVFCLLFREVLFLMVFILVVFRFVDYSFVRGDFRVGGGYLFFCRQVFRVQREVRECRIEGRGRGDGCWRLFQSGC